MAIPHWERILNDLESGIIRAAIKKKGRWEADKSVKKAILETFKSGKLVKRDGFIDKDNLMPRDFELMDKIRIVPGGSTVRRGAYVGARVVIMPPSYINIGAFVDEDTMVDSHVLVGSCAQIGKRVHLSAGVQIGGVLEPIGERPVIVEDDVFVGAGVVIVEGICIKKGAVIAPGVHLSHSIPVYDCVNERILEKGEDIGEYSIVVPGTRKVGDHLSWASRQKLQMNCALIIKHRDKKSDASLLLESSLRE